MIACIQMRSDFIYSVTGKLGEFIFEIKGAEDTAFLPKILPVAPGLYLSIMTGPATAYLRIDFRVGNTPVKYIDKNCFLLRKRDCKFRTDICLAFNKRA